ncbi:hypothetical protein PtA15_15A102 [Puccinia triticina]|uniref:Uncharacterized protein n=1 Tax=Puccinia triticina TaxID=208348 RepID=A0ABY7D2S9_9BASI|nr:uncharacterized protein PtA15_15A102 [Puccinia triticina]WAQ91711.1 hypothetical protein PtA15_15A102 [Puccinia triticina]
MVPSPHRPLLPCISMGCPRGGQRRTSTTTKDNFHELISQAIQPCRLKHAQPKVPLVERRPDPRVGRHSTRYSATA